MKASVLIIICLLISLDGKTQLAGRTSYSFLDLASTARVTGLGGTLVSVRDDDVALSFHNPSVLSDSAAGAISFSNLFMLGGSAYNALSYAHHLDSAGITLAGHINYLSYGDIPRTDELGVEMGTVRPSDLAISLTVSKELYERMSVGASLRYIQSRYEPFSSSALAIDLGASYYVYEKGLLATLVVRNLGRQLSPFLEQRESLPVDVLLGLSKRLAHLPFRFNVTAHHLNVWNLQYDNPFSRETNIILGGTNNTSEEGSGTIDNIMRHLLFSGEFLLGRRENVRLRLGYNHMLRQDLKISGGSNFGGLTFGFGLRVSKFRVDFGHGIYHSSGGMNHLTISTHLDWFRRL